MSEPGTFFPLPAVDPAPARPDLARFPTEIVLLDRAGVIVWVNQAWRDFARDNAADPATTGVGASYLAACAAAGDDPDAAAVADAIRAALRGGLPGPLTVCIPCDSPTEHRRFDVLISERRDDSGDPAGAALALMRQVEPLAGHAAIFRNAPYAVICADADGRACAANPAACALLGRSESQLLTIDPSDLVDPADQRRWVEAHAAVLKDRAFRGELSVLRADGGSFPVEVAAWGLATGGGEGFAMILRDATDLAERRRSEVAQGVRELVLRERERIVDAVHASVLQDLFAVGLMLGAIDTGSVHIEQAAGLVHRTIAELRTIVAPPTSWGPDSGPLDGRGSGRELAEILDRVSVEARADQTERLHLEAELSASLDRVAVFEAKKHFRLGYSHLMAAALGNASRSIEEHLALESATGQIRAQLDTATRVLADAADSIRATGSAGADRSSFDLAVLAAGVVEQGGRFFAFTATLELVGPLDAVPSRIGYELLAALAELLTGLGTDARADEVGVSISVARGRVTLKVADNGPTTRTRIGGTLQDTLSDRIGPLGGTLELRRRRSAGSVVTWQVPLDAPN